MPYIVGDFLDQVERELVRARRDLARRVDRVEALAALRSLALSVSADLQRAITAEDVFTQAKDERERARLQALTDRITRGDEEPGANPASSEEGEQGERL
jgi:hypothetical protein